MEFPCSCRNAVLKLGGKNITLDVAENDALNRFFDENNALIQSKYDGSRPRKRQRMSLDDGDGDKTDAKISGRPSIPIARVTLNFSPSREAGDIFAGGNLDGSVQVGLTSALIVDESRGMRRGPYSRPPPVWTPRPMQLTVASPKLANKNVSLDFEMVHDMDEKAYKTLCNIALIERRFRVKGRGVARTECRLSRFQGPIGLSFSLECTIFWLDGESAFGPLSVQGDSIVLANYFPQTHSQIIPKWSWSPQDFYDTVYSTPPDLPLPARFGYKILETDLYPFQKRAVSWMLDRENLVNTQSRLSFVETQDVTGATCLVSHLQGVVSTYVGREHVSEPKGGILAEEMGLGKTCELIALICLNRRAELAGNGKGEVSNDSERLISSGATLIVTPPTILQQWKDEIAKHAPDLSYYHYEGMVNAKSKAKYDEDSILQHFMTNDVILTTYSVLAREVHFAIDPPKRSMRERTTVYERARSPLRQIHWWRVCLDEAQMVESGVSAAARVAALLPRVNAWAVTGTPLRKNVEDLFGLLTFLRYQPFCDSAVVRKLLITEHKSIFQEVFGHIALRHSKDKIRGELRLPPQRRVVLTMSFTAIEEQNYKSLFEEMHLDVGCAVDGSPLLDDWNPKDYAERMRSWLMRLRQTCLHPQVGGRNKRALGRGNAPLRTVAEVLEVMIDQNELTVRIESRAVISALLLTAHIIGNARDDQKRAVKALEVYKTALQQAEDIVSDCRDVLRKVVIPGDVQSELDGSDDDDEERNKTPEHAARVRARAALHSALQMQHACAFFVGTAYFQIKSNEEITEADSAQFTELEKQETAYYDVAKLIRRELLRDNTKKAERLMNKVKPCKALAVGDIDLLSLENTGGIENVKIASKAEDLADILDAQARLINEWRSKVIELLLKPLVDEDEGIETTGDEYEESTKQQDTLYAYSDALRAIVADRGTCLTGQSAPLVDHEMNVLGREAREGNGHAPEILLKLLAQRSKLKQKHDAIISLRGLSHEARGLETSLQWHDSSSVRANAELLIVQRQLRDLAAITAKETKVLTDLEKSLDLFRSTMNQRLEFYRQLQQISDSVAPYKEESDVTLDVVALKNATRAQEAKVKSLAQLKTKHRFYIHLREESNSTSEVERLCVICQCPFEQGVLTVCGHQYCKECISIWWKQHRTCPVCKRRLQTADFHDVTYKPRELRAQEESHTNSETSSPGGPETPHLRSASLYADISSETLSQIKSIDLNGSYGTKIDTLARHVLWLRQHDPGAKSIVFSQYREFLDVLGTAFKDFGIVFSRMGKAGAIDKFKHDASVEVFLLDAKTDSSGLNLVNAQHVFLVEPLINTAIELQAIARVHRIGQQRTTTVYMYLISGTVEEAIYDISVTRRLEHMQRGNNASRSGKSRSATPMLGEAAIDAANSLEMQQAPISKLLQGKEGGEVVAQDDLWGCLFGKSKHKAHNASDELQTEVGRHLRAEAADQRLVK